MGEYKMRNNCTQQEFVLLTMDCANYLQKVCVHKTRKMITNDFIQNLYKKMTN